MERFLPPSSAEAIQREITGTIRRHAGGMEAQTTPSGRVSDRFTALRDATRLVKLTEGLVGNMPPEPPTLRGRAGAWMIRKIRRALFWYTPAILEFHHNVTRATERQVDAIEEMLREHEALRERVNGLESGLRQEIENSIHEAHHHALEQLRDDLMFNVEQIRRELSAKVEQAPLSKCDTASAR